MTASHAAVKEDTTGSVNSGHDSKENPESFIVRGFEVLWAPDQLVGHRCREHGTIVFRSFTQAACAKGPYNDKDFLMTRYFRAKAWAMQCRLRLDEADPSHVIP